MAHNNVDTPVSAGTHFAQQQFGGTSNRQEMTLPIPESASMSGYDVTTSSTTAIAANSARVGVFVQNVSDTDIWLGFGATAVVNAGLRLQAGDWVEVRWQGTITAIHGGSSTKRLAYTDFSTT